MAEHAIISVRGVDKVFNSGSDRAVTRIQDIDLTIGRGEFISLLGPSGCGKSTLLRVMADLTGPTSGTVTVNGKTPGAATPTATTAWFSSQQLFSGAMCCATSNCRSRWQG
ncbi:Vitamin B12 import ATP-binding protein BtuD [Streptomyces hirsutus]